MPAAFLGSKTIKQLLGYDFTKSEDRAAYIGIYGSVANFMAAICFSLPMLFSFPYGNYFFLCSLRLVLCQ